MFVAEPAKLRNANSSAIGSRNRSRMDASTSIRSVAASGLPGLSDLRASSICTRGSGLGFGHSCVHSLNLQTDLPNPEAIPITDLGGRFDKAISKLCLTVVKLQ